jgi:predicted ester cyclase
MTTVEQNKAMVRRIFEEGMDQHKPAVYYELLAPDFVNHTYPLPQAGPAGFAMMGEMYTNAFSGFKVTYDSVVGEGNQVFTRGNFSGTHTGVFNGIPATGKTVRVGFMDSWVVKDGKLSENWVQLDMFGLLQQLGVIPQPQSA